MEKKYNKWSRVSQRRKWQNGKKSRVSREDKVTDKLWYTNILIR